MRMQDKIKASIVSAIAAAGLEPLESGEWANVRQFTVTAPGTFATLFTVALDCQSSRASLAILMPGETLCNNAACRYDAGGKIETIRERSFYCKFDGSPTFNTLDNAIAAVAACSRAAAASLHPAPQAEPKALPAPARGKAPKTRKDRLAGLVRACAANIIERGDETEILGFLCAQLGSDLDELLGEEAPAA